MCMIWAFTLRSSFYSRHFIGKNAPGPWLASAHHVLFPPPKENTPTTHECLLEGGPVREMVCGGSIECRGTDEEETFEVVCRLQVRGTFFLPFFEFCL